MTSPDTIICQSHRLDEFIEFFREQLTFAETREPSVFIYSGDDVYFLRADSARGKRQYVFENPVDFDAALKSLKRLGVEIDRIKRLCKWEDFCKSEQNSS